jgi:hypothetical protein
MTSIYQDALGNEFARLHPQMQRRFGFASDDGIAHVGNGIMDEIWRGRLYTLPFLYVGTWRRIMFPDRGRNIPFRIENFAYRDGLGRETVTWLRTFSINGHKRRFDAYMINSQSRGLIVDYLGSHQHLAVDIELQVDERASMNEPSDLSFLHSSVEQLRYASGLTMKTNASISTFVSQIHTGVRYLGTEVPSRSKNSRETRQRFRHMLCLTAKRRESRENFNEYQADVCGKRALLLASDGGTAQQLCRPPMLARKTAA